jgi:hypothetical protein
MFAYGQIHSGMMHTILVRLSLAFISIMVHIASSVVITMVLERYVMVVALTKIPEVLTTRFVTASFAELRLVLLLLAEVVSFGRLRQRM